MFWKLMERFGVQGSQFILQLVLARLLNPEHYGTLSIMIIFTNLANVFIQTGFNTALIQNKDVTEEDYSSVFWVSISIAVLLYGVIFFAAPLIAVFYAMPGIVAPLRVISLILLPGALNSIQLARISRNMDFKKIFYSSVAAILVSGVAGILVAVLGGGLWALVVQTALNVSISCVVMSVTSGLRLKLICNLHRVKTLFSFGWKLLVSALLETISQDLQSLVVGKKYDSGTLGYYNKGKNFPQVIMNTVSASIQSVMLPAMSAHQQDLSQVKALARNSISMSAYIVFPMMTGLAAVGTPLIRLLLTEKWLPCVPYMQIYCAIMALYPVNACNLQAINALGRSDVYLKLEIVKKTLSISLLVFAVTCFDTPIAIALSGLVGNTLCTFVNIIPNRKLIRYGIWEQLWDMLPPLALCGAMLASVLAVGVLPLGDLPLLILQVITGVAVYLLLSLVLRPKPFRELLEMLRQMKK